jgi:hypothetical protein
MMEDSFLEIGIGLDESITSSIGAIVRRVSWYLDDRDDDASGWYDDDSTGSSISRTQSLSPVD